MPFVVSISPRAQKKVIRLQSYLAKRFYPGGAERYIERILDACNSLALAPQRGTMRNDLSPGVRAIGFERTATIYFKVVKQQVIIVNIMYRGHTRGSLR